MSPNTVNLINARLKHQYVLPCMWAADNTKGPIKTEPIGLAPATPGAGSVALVAYLLTGTNRLECLSQRGYNSAGGSNGKMGRFSIENGPKKSPQVEVKTW